MCFIDIFEPKQVKQIFDESCKHAKPGCDKITSKVFEKNFAKNLSIIQRQISLNKYKFSRFEVFLKTKKHY